MPRKNMSLVDRRQFIKSLGLAGVTAPFFRSAEAFSKMPVTGQLLYVGTYTTGTASEGIYVYRLDAKLGKLSPQKAVSGVTDPSFLAVESRSRNLYAVNETLEFNGIKSGAVSAFSIDRQTGDLSFLNKQPSMGAAPCYVSISKNDRFVLVANYFGGNVAVFPIDMNGALRSAVEIKQHVGTGPNKVRQDAAHAHWIDLDERGRLAAACDLGADKVFLYRFDQQTGKLSPNPNQSFYQTKPGAGPRHFTFHPNGKLGYVLNELNATVDVLSYDADAGTLRHVHSVSTLPANWTGENTCAQILLSPDGAFLYCSNRGHDSIVSYNVDKANGKLSYIEHVRTGGKAPRNFVIDPSGSVLLAANQRSDSIVIFMIDRKTGMLQPSGNEIAVPSPVCLTLIPVDR